MACCLWIATIFGLRSRAPHKSSPSNQDIDTGKDNHKDVNEEMYFNDSEQHTADYCPEDESADVPHPIAFACSRTIIPADPPWPTREEYFLNRQQDKDNGQDTCKV